MRTAAPTHHRTLMRLIITSLLTAVLFAALPTQAVTAWDGSNCNGAKGLDVPCNGSCIAFSGRHSFRVNVSLDDASRLYCVLIKNFNRLVADLIALPSLKGTIALTDEGTGSSPMLVSRANAQM
jgi:hypothetical protein